MKEYYFTSIPTAEIYRMVDKQFNNVYCVVRFAFPSNVEYLDFELTEDDIKQLCTAYQTYQNISTNHILINSDTITFVNDELRISAPFNNCITVFALLSRFKEY